MIELNLVQLVPRSIYIYPGKEYMYLTGKGKPITEEKYRLIILKKQVLIA